MNIVTLKNPVNLFRAPAEVPPPNWRALGHQLRRFGEGIIAGVVLVIVLFSVFFAHLLTPYEPTAGMSLRDRFMPPAWLEGGSWEHPFGTDNLGRDVLARTLYGGRVSLSVAFVASSFSMILGVVVGLVSGYMGGLLDRFVLRLTEFWIAFPFLVLALAVIAVVGSTPMVLIMLMSLSGWVYPARVTRAQTLKLRQSEYVQSAISIGASPFHVIRFHIVPDIVSVNIILWTLTFGALILVESSLSFIGLGVSPPTPSWGNMLSDSKTYLQDAWWISVVPGLALMITILCINTVGDTLQKYTSRYLLG